MMRDSESDPVLAKVWTESEKRVTGVDKLVVEAELGLQVGSIAEDVHILLQAWKGMFGFVSQYMAR